MTTALILTLVLACASVVGALLLWRASVPGAARLVLLGVTGVMSTGATLVESAAAKYTLMGATALLIVAQLATLDRSTWRALRPLLWLGGAVSLASVVSYLLDEVRPEVQIGLLVLVAAFSAALIVMMIVRGIELLRSTQAKQH